MQNRDAPAYQEYAAAMLAAIPFRSMTLEERGLLFTLRLECWINFRLPQNPEALAKVLGLPSDQVSNSLAAVMPFFSLHEGHIFSPELESYRQHLEQRKAKQSEGGKRGSATANSKRGGAADNSTTPATTSATTLPTTSATTLPTTSATTLPTTSATTSQGSCESLVQYSTAQQSQKQSTEKGTVQDPWLDDYAAAETQADIYQRASRGE